MSNADSDDGDIDECHQRLDNILIRTLLGIEEAGYYEDLLVIVLCNKRPVETAQAPFEELQQGPFEIKS